MTTMSRDTAHDQVVHALRDGKPKSDSTTKTYISTLISFFRKNRDDDE
eukprot:gene28211-34065_t